MLMVMVAAVALGFSGMALAQGTPPAAAPPAGAPAAPPAEGGKPDCTEKQKALDDAKEAAKTAAAKPDLTACKEMKGQEKKDCETPIKDKSKADATAAKDKVKEAKMAVDCCKNPKKKGCTM
jgi:hypothetical protein